MTQYLESRWKSGGIERVAHTERIAGEDDKTFVARHQALEVEMLKTWPKDP